MVCQDPYVAGRRRNAARRVRAEDARRAARRRLQRAVPQRRVHAQARSERKHHAQDLEERFHRREKCWLDLIFGLYIVYRDVTLFRGPGVVRLQNSRCKRRVQQRGVVGIYDLAILSAPHLFERGCGGAHQETRRPAPAPQVTGPEQRGARRARRRARRAAFGARAAAAGAGGRCARGGWYDRNNERGGGGGARGQHRPHRAGVGAVHAAHA